MLIFLSPDPREGREPVAPARGVRAGARGRGQQATHPGGAGAPPGGTTAPCEELADGGRLGRPSRSAVSPVEGGGSKGPKGTPRAEPKARPGAGVRTPRWRAERRHVPETVRDYGYRRAAWRAIPSVLRGERNRKTAYPGPQRIRAVRCARYLYPPLEGEGREP